MVRLAAKATLAAGGVRVLEETFVESGKPDGLDWSARGEGVADLAGCRAEITRTLPRAVSDIAVATARRVHEKVPWFLGEEELDAVCELKNTPIRTVYVGGAEFSEHAYGDGYIGTGDFLDSRRRRRDPIWIIEALRCADDADARGEGQVRSVSCAHFGFHVDPERHPGELRALAPVPGIGALRVLGEVWIDEQQRVRRATWRDVSRRRSRRHGRTFEGECRTWTTTELWDFGMHVAIATPRVRSPEHDTARSFKDAAITLWRRKRGYDRRQYRADRLAAP
ncbi:MAG: hypothetical protein M3065_10505 [Actinomycetota bacterium]|nr:hypothetical protein [Actinomycetota bacterium]